MFLFFFCFFLISGQCKSDESELGFSLHIGNAIDIFANYGDLSQVTQVVSADYEEEDEDDQEPAEPFREKNIRVFNNVTSTEVSGHPMAEMNLLLCETFDDLLNTYFKNFQIEGTEKPWKAFMGDWIMDEILRTFGIELDNSPDNCCYVLVKMTKIHKLVKIKDEKGLAVKEYVQKAVERLNISDTAKIRRFMKSYGTHYIDYYQTGNFIYQVFKYKRTGYNRLRAYIQSRNNNKTTSDNLRFYFSSYFLKQVGEIRIASGNKTVENWARKHLRDSQYLYSRPSLLRLHYNPSLAYKLNDLLDTKALLGLGLKTLKPIFKNSSKAERYAETVENDLLLWEVNA